MLDFIKSLDLSEELKINEIYYLFKTDSSEANLQLLSTLQKFKTNKDFLNYYTNQDCKSTVDIYDNILFISSEICKEKGKTKFRNINDNYISGFSKIIFLFLLLQKHNELLSKLLMNTKKYINKFYKDFQPGKTVKEKINLCLDDLTNYTLVAYKGNYSSSPKKEGSFISSQKTSSSSILRNKTQNLNPNLFDLNFFKINTPKFEEEENALIEEIEEPKNPPKKIIKNDNIKTKFDSTLSLSKMTFALTPDDELKASKAKSEKKKIDCNSKDSKKNIYNIQMQQEDTNIQINNVDLRKLILAKFFDIINDLHKHGKISDEMKLSAKQLLISDHNLIVDRFINNNCGDPVVNKKIPKSI